MPFVDLESHRSAELAVAVGVSFGVFVSAAALAFSYVHEKVKQLQESVLQQESSPIKQ